MLVSLAAACAIQNKPTSQAGLPQENYSWQLPAGFHPPPVPVSNPMSDAKVRLGRRLFYDSRLSVNGRGSCASCHRQELAFTDGKRRAAGVTGEQHSRSSMTLVNVAYNQDYTWASQDVKTLEEQILIPLFNVAPVELGMRGNEKALLENLATDKRMVSWFQQAFPQDHEPLSIENLVKSLAAFVRTIIAADSAFDRLLYLDDRQALSDSAARGMQLFFSEEIGCSQCHLGENLAGGQVSTTAEPLPTEFHNTALYNVGGENRYPSVDSGLRMESGDARDDGKFRAPGLRNIAITAPYMHDGSIATLSAVIDHYAAGGRTIVSGKNAGVGTENTNKSHLLKGFSLSDAERLDLIRFLESLTDDALLEDRRFSIPLTEP